MSVLIKGMEMPTSCHACCFFGQADIWESDFDGYTKSFCTRTGSKTYDYVDKFLPNCPLTPVPPHGDLIDRKQLIKSDHQHYEYMSDEFYITVRDVEDAPTIIPAEEGK